MSSQSNKHSSWEWAVRVVKPNQFDSNTPQTEGMRRVSAISKQLADTKGIWAGVTTVEAHVGTGKHHHGEQETVIYVATGSVQMAWGDNLEFQTDAEGGDFIYVPPFVPHKEINAGDIPSQWIIVRTGQEPIVVNLEPMDSDQQAINDSLHGLK
ncbi:cupin domain-containing protein [Ktedonospora formicarum]|uniref:Mannose-6-phosphate isomerase n=1 Tax=Ktedonospora formicarum TaxID=2778364 RepID=A0A8J3MX60_9CHLR|nr:cupin domain-containing protein [Ktedonospora formicarum]GHO51100.1 mannose-6-phosphate isomerase [Ktedonospora formicarum]